MLISVCRITPLESNCSCEDEQQLLHAGARPLPKSLPSLSSDAAAKTFALLAVGSQQQALVVDDESILKTTQKERPISALLPSVTA